MILGEVLNLSTATCMTHIYRLVVSEWIEQSLDTVTKKIAMMASKLDILASVTNARDFFSNENGKVSYNLQENKITGYSSPEKREIQTRSKVKGLNTNDNTYSDCKNAGNEYDTENEEFLLSKDWELSENRSGKYYLDFKSPYFTMAERIRILEAALEDIRERYCDIKEEYQRLNRRCAKWRRKRRQSGN